MEQPDSSAPRDTPEQNSVPEQTAEPELWVQGFRSIAIDRELGERVISQIHENGSLMLELSRQWKEFDKEIELKELALRKKILDLEKKEERLRLVEEREKKIEVLEVSITERLHEKEKESDLKQFLETDAMRLVLEMQNEKVGTQLKEQEKLLGLVHGSMVKKHEELVRELEARKDEIGLLSKSIDDKSRELAMTVKEFDMKQTVETERMKKEAELMAISHKQLEAREKELRLLNETIKEKSTELEKKEENFQLKQKAEAREIEVKSKFLELKEKKLEERENKLELKQREFEERLVQAETRKRSRLEFEPSLLAEKGGHADSLIRPGKKHKLIKEHNYDDEEKETHSACVLHGETSSDSESEDTSESMRREVVCIDVDEVDEDPEPFSCPDPDFNDFSNTMSSFAVGQVWALYDPIDDMPRYYARIKRVLKPQMSLRVTWLESIQTTESEKLIPIACGRFKYGDSETKSHLTFSHEMHHIVLGKNITINPRKGETWALFRDWNKTWNSHREQHKPPYRYDFVEVVSEFNSDQGIGVAYLGRVEGFTSVYELAEQHGFVKMMISCDEMLRFSHRVPSYKLNGDEKEGIPNGSFELDPAAIPQACLNDYALALV